jgi:hypothetical protein
MAALRRLDRDAPRQCRQARSTPSIRRPHICRAPCFARRGRGCVEHLRCESRAEIGCAESSSEVQKREKRGTEAREARGGSQRAPSRAPSRHNRRMYPTRVRGAVSAPRRPRRRIAAYPRRAAVAAAATRWSLVTAHLVYPVLIYSCIQPLHLQPLHLQPLHLQPLHLQPLHLQPLHLQPLHLQPHI